MKRLFLFVAVATLGLMTSCSSDDNKGGNGSGNSTLKVTIDGDVKTFNTIVVNEEVWDEDYTELQVSATINSNPTEYIAFNLQKGKTGTSAVTSFYYVKDGAEYNSYYGNLSVFVETNSNGKLKGTFSGSVGMYIYDENWDSELVTIPLTNGSFDISY